MPRTKRPVRKQEKTSEDDEAMKKLHKQIQEQYVKLDARNQMEIRNIELAFKILIGSISKDDLHKTIDHLKTELPLIEISRTKQTRSSARAASHDDGYLTENSSQSSGGKGTSKTESQSSRSVRRSRSADPSRRVPPSARRTPQARSRSVYKTPAYNKGHPTANYPAITPKVTPHTPLTVLRQPRQGEMVVSMSGSPVMVPSCYTMHPEEKANCNILLQDGTMLSLQPQQLRQSQAFIPFSLMDSNVLKQLKTLKDNLDKVVKLGEKQIK